MVTIYSIDVLLFLSGTSLFSMSSSNCCFLTCIQVSLEADQVVRYSHVFQNSPQFIVTHRAKDFKVQYSPQNNLPQDLLSHVTQKEQIQIGRKFIILTRNSGLLCIFEISLLCVAGCLTMAGAGFVMIPMVQTLAISLDSQFSFSGVKPSQVSVLILVKTFSCLKIIF